MLHLQAFRKPMETLSLDQNVGLYVNGGSFSTAARQVTSPT